MGRRRARSSPKVALDPNRLLWKLPGAAKLCRRDISATSSLGWRDGLPECLDEGADSLIVDLEPTVHTRQLSHWRKRGDCAYINQRFQRSLQRGGRHSEPTREFGPSGSTIGL